MPTDPRLDVDVLLGVPEQLFIEFSQTYGSGGEGQLSFGISTTDIYLVRPLFGLTDRNPQEFAREKPCGALLYQKTDANPGSVYANLHLLRWMPQTVGEIDDSRTLLHLVVSKRRTYEDHLGGGEGYILSANAKFPFGEGFSLVQEPDHWPITQKLLARFAELASGFPFKVREKEKRYYMA
jgi:hypothetical protein